MPSAVHAPSQPASVKQVGAHPKTNSLRDESPAIDRPHSKVVFADWCVLIASITAAVVFTATWSSDWLANDTAQTLSVARNLASSGEIATDVIYYEEHLQFTASSVPQTVFPPGYPAVIAALMQLGISDVLAAQGVVALSFAAVPLLMFWLLRSFGLKPEWSAAIILFWLAMQPMWWNAQGLQSELPFIACTLGTVACLRHSEASVVSSRWALTAGALTAVACSFRYAGVFFAFSVGLVLATGWLFNRNRVTFWRCAMFTLLPLSTLTAMFARNASLVGDLKGGNNHLSVKPLGEVARTTWYSLSGLVGWSRVGVMQGEVSELLLAAAVVAAGILTLSRFVRRPAQPPGAPARWETSRVIPITYCGVSIAGLFWLERTTSVGLCPRLLLPIIPFALLALGQLIGCCLSDGRLPRARFAAAALALLALFAGQMELWASHRQPPIVKNVRAAVASLAASDSVEITSLADRRPILCNECHSASNVLRLPVIGLATPNYTSREWNHDTVRELVERYDVRLVMVFADVLEDGEEATAYFEQLAMGDIPDWLTPLVTEGPVLVFQVRQEAN